MDSVGQRCAAPRESCSRRLRARQIGPLGADVARARCRSLPSAQLERKGEEELLRAIVEIPLELAPFGLADLRDSAARRPQLVHPTAKLQLKALVLDRQTRLRAEVLVQQV